MKYKSIKWGESIYYRESDMGSLLSHDKFKHLTQEERRKVPHRVLTEIIRFDKEGTQFLVFIPDKQFNELIDDLELTN